MKKIDSQKDLVEFMIEEAGGQTNLANKAGEQHNVIWEAIRTPRNMSFTKLLKWARSIDVEIFARVKKK